jgi:hypothetical protein
MIAGPKGSGRLSKLSGAGCLVMFGLFWSALTVGADVAIGWSVFRQLHALSYSTTTGRVTQSEIKKVEGDDGPTYRPDIKYTYSVAGREHTADRYRYGEWSAGRGRAEGVAATHPVGSEVSVYYAPADPSDAVLKVGLEGMDLFLAMFMLPFNVVMAVFCWAGGREIYRSFLPSPTGGAKVSDDGFRVRVGLSPTIPVLGGLVVAGILAFALTFVIGFGFGGSPSYPLMLLVWAVILVGGTWGYLHHRSKQVRGDFDLVLDVFGRSITLPRTLGRTTDVVVPMSSVTSIEVEQVEKRRSKGSVHYAYSPTLVFTDDDGMTRRERLIEWSDAKRAGLLTGWLCKRLGLKPNGPNPRPGDSTD